MKGIKKPLIILLVLILSIRTTGAIMAENGGADHIMPKEEDYMFSAGAITGLSTDFLSGLTDEQKQNIHLVIPGTINGQTVTSIAKDAFKLRYNTKYSGSRFVSLDLSNASGLTSIGENAFYGASGISGSLKIPSKVTAIGNSAFRGCTGITK